VTDGDAERASLRQFQATPKSVAVDGGDDDLPQGLDLAGHLDGQPG
jgi:hypothetical protein